MDYFGPHMVIDLSDCNREKLADRKLVYNTLLELPEKIGMTRISVPDVFSYSGVVPEDCGVTGVVVLAESHCSIHTFQEKGYCFVDIFSCKQFDTDKALHELVGIFEARACEMRIIERGKNFPR